MKIAMFVGRRLVRLAVSLFVVSLLTFGLLQLAPGDFASIQSVGGGNVGLAQAASEGTAQDLQTRYGTDVPVWQQYTNFMIGAVTGDMGPSYRYPHLQIEEIIAEGFPISGLLAVTATLIALAVAIPIGVIAAVRRRTLFDSGTMFVVTIGNGLPNYLAGLILVLIFGVGLGVLPIYGWDGPKNMILPSLALAIAPIAILARHVRSSMLENLRQEYVVTARSKGGRESVVLTKHVLRNSLMPLITVVGPMFASLATGTIFVEQIFGIPGLGHYFTEAAVSRDMPLLMGSTLFFAFLVMAMNLLVDLSYAVLDPRVRADMGLLSTGSRRQAAAAEGELDASADQPATRPGPATNGAI